MKIDPNTLLLIGAGAAAIFVLKSTVTSVVSAPVNATVNHLAKSEVTADDKVFARITLINPFATDAQKEAARNLLAALEFQENL
tara:strand:+ start:1975 stop:2226 length:252 start_codon:yes stop_codon:yes gene_type:complete